MGLTFPDVSLMGSRTDFNVTSGLRLKIMSAKSAAHASAVAEWNAASLSDRFILGRRVLGALMGVLVGLLDVAFDHDDLEHIVHPDQDPERDTSRLVRGNPDPPGGCYPR